MPIAVVRYPPMLFYITQHHTPKLCPKNAGGSKILHDSQAKGVKLQAVYGAFAEHVVYYAVEADSLDAVNTSPSFTGKSENRQTLRAISAASFATEEKCAKSVAKRRLGH